MVEEYAKKTRDTLGKIIKKPPLTDKLLGKPPFRFLHDITTEVIRTTGFLNGLFTPEEMDSRSVSAKEDKMEFLRKIIDVVSIVYGDQLTARPSKIVAGQDPDKTNELLQAMAKCIKRNLSSDDAVQQVLSGKKPSKVQEKPPSGSSKRKEGKENRERSDDQRKKKKDRDEERHDRDRSSDRRRRSASKDGRERSRDKEEGEGNDERERRSHRDKSHEKDRNREDRSKDRREDRKERKESKPKLKESGKSLHKGLERKTSSSRKLQKSSSTEKKQETVSKTKKNAAKHPKDDTSDKKKKSKREEEHHERDDNDNKEGKDENDQVKPDADDEGTERPSGSGRPPRPASAKGHRRRPAPDRSSRHQAPDEGNPPETRSRPARPPSARPAAPRVRQRPDPAEEEIARMESAGRHRTAPIITDSGSHPGGDGMSSSDEDEQFLVQEEDEIQPPDMGKLSPVTNGDAADETGEGEQHGGLVRKILETKKELETSASKGANVTGKKRTEIERPPVNEAQRRKEREVVMRDIEKLRSSVQKLCRSAVPLGKIIDYIQEDMDSMQNELLQWKKENKEHAAKLKEEESVTTKTIEPLRAELQELDRSISAQMDMIAASKCNVIRNQEKIDKMIAGVTARS